MLEYVNVLNNICQRRRISVAYKELREGPHHDETWTLTVYGKTSYLHAILISNLPGSVDGIERGQGTGKAKIAAKVAAAKAAVEFLGQL